MRVLFFLLIYHITLFQTGEFHGITTPWIEDLRASEFPRFANRSVQSIHRIAISSGKNVWMKGDFAGTPLIWRGTPCIPVNVVKSISRCLHWTCEEIAEKTEVLMQKENQLSAPWTAWRHGQLANSLHHGLDDVQNYSYIHRFEYHINC